MRGRLLLCLMAALLLGGCYPEERIWWSPKGDRAVVLLADRVLHLMNAQGELGPALFGGQSFEDWGVLTVAWLPDGSGILCSRTRQVRSWEAVKAQIPNDEAETVEKRLGEVIPAFQAMIKNRADPATIQTIESLCQMKEKALFMAGLRILFQTRRGDIEQLLRPLPHGEKLIAELDDPGKGFSVVELCLLKLDAAAPAEPQALATRLLSLLMAPRVSPRHEALAYLELNEGDDGENARLMVQTLDGKGRLEVAQRLSTLHYQWLPDGRSLVFTSPMAREGDSIQCVRRVTALQASGELMKPAYELGTDGKMGRVEGADRLSEARTLAMAVMPDRHALQVLPDGRVLFASQPVTLPLPGDSVPLDPRLYVISADGSALHEVPTQPGDLPTDLNFFVVSPSGSHIAVVEKGTDAVALVEVDTGRTQIISELNPGWKCETVPAWKTDTELTFAGLNAVTKRPQLKVWSAASGISSLSEKWPANATEKWLSPPKSETPQAQSP